MSNTPTATAVAGKFQSKDGNDLVQYLNSQGQVVLWIDADGVLRINTTAAQGAVLQMGLPSGDDLASVDAVAEGTYPVGVGRRDAGADSRLDGMTTAHDRSNQLLSKVEMTQRFALLFGMDAERQVICHRSRYANDPGNILGTSYRVFHRT